MQSVRSGIYAITNTVTGKVYVGASVDIDARWQTHRSELRRGTHHNKDLQSDWLNCSDEVFQFDVVEIVTSPDEIGQREAYHVLRLQTLNKGGVYNSSSQMGVGLHHAATAYLKRHDAEKYLAELQSVAQASVDIFTLEELAILRGVPVRIIRQWLHHGLSSVLRGGKCFISLPAFDAFMTDRVEITTAYRLKKSEDELEPGDE